MFILLPPEHFSHLKLILGHCILFCILSRVSPASCFHNKLQNHCDPSLAIQLWKIDGWTQFTVLVPHRKGKPEFLLGPGCKHNLRGSLQAYTSASDDMKCIYDLWFSDLLVFSCSVKDMLTSLIPFIYLLVRHCTHRDHRTHKDHHTQTQTTVHTETTTHTHKHTETTTHTDHCTHKDHRTYGDHHVHSPLHM